MIELASSASFNQILMVLTGFRKMNPAFASFLLQFMDQESLKRLADWSVKFSEELNKLPSPMTEKDFRAIDPNTDDDFFAVMNNTSFIGDKLTPDILMQASNQMTKAVKAENWIEAVKVGIALSGCVVS